MDNGLIGGGLVDEGASGNQKRAYEAPEIIYEGELTTRAGSQIPGPKEYDVDPTKLFGNL